jgi:hypothetical protein
MRSSFGCFFWRRFLFCALAQLFDFCFLPLKNNQLKKQKAMCCMAWATKTMTEKTAVWGKPFFILFCAVAGWIIIFSTKEKDLFFTASFLFQVKKKVISMDDSF